MKDNTKYSLRLLIFIHVTGNAGTGMGRENGNFLKPLPVICSSNKEAQTAKTKTITYFVRCFEVDETKQ